MHRPRFFIIAHFILFLTSVQLNFEAPINLLLHYSRTLYDVFSTLIRYPLSIWQMFSQKWSEQNKLRVEISNASYFL